MTFSERETRSRRAALRLGLLNGLLIGLALALGTWVLQVIGLATVPIGMLYPPIILGGVALSLLGSLAGWSTALARSSLAGALIWAAAAFLMALVINHVPYEGHNLALWLSDGRARGLTIYPFTESAQVRFWLSGFFPALLLVILGLLQDYRLEGLEAEVGADGRLSARGWLSLALPALLVVGAGLIADNIVNSPWRAGPRLVHEVIQTGRTYSGNLFELSLEKGTNYNAIGAVREQMSDNYTLSVAAADLGAAETVYVVADFDNGAWIICSVVSGNLSNCYDASPPYTRGLSALITDGEFPQDCPTCRFRVSDEQRDWLAGRGGDFDGEPLVTRLGQWGSYVLMAAASVAGDHAIECRFHNLIPVTLEDCWESEASSATQEARQPTLEGSPTIVTTASTQATPTPDPVRAPVTAFSLALYAPAMRDAFVEDLAAVGPVSQYRIQVQVDALAAALRGHETVRYVNDSTSTQEAVYFRLFPNLPGYGGEMTVSEVRVGVPFAPPESAREAEGSTQPVELQADGTALRVTLPEPLQPGEETTISFSFETSVPTTAGDGYGQFIYQQDVMALANFFPLIPAYHEENCAHFGNCDGGWNIEVAVPYGDAVFSATALFEVWVTALEGWTVVASGSTLDKNAGPQDTQTWHIVSGPMRDFSMVLSPRFEVATQKVDDITVNSYYLPEDAPGGKRVLQWAAESLELFNSQFGPYPFAEFDVAATPTRAGGIEYPGLIVMPIRNYGDTSGRFQWSTVHEVAHQWWYSLVGNDQLDEPWVDEALTQYSTVLYYELHERWDGAVSEVLEPRYGQVAGTDQDEPFTLPVAGYTASNYGPVVYAKGPLFFHALRQAVGDEAFYTILKSYFNAYRYDIASGSDLPNLAESVSGKDLGELYQEWLGDSE